MNEWMNKRLNHNRKKKEKNYNKDTKQNFDKQIIMKNKSREKKTKQKWILIRLDYVSNQLLGQIGFHLERVEMCK